MRKTNRRETLSLKESRRKSTPVILSQIGLRLGWGNRILLHRDPHMMEEDWRPDWPGSGTSVINITNQSGDAGQAGRCSRLHDDCSMLFAGRVAVVRVDQEVLQDGWLVWQ